MAKEKKIRKHPKLRLALLVTLLLFLVTAIFMALFIYIKYGDRIEEAKKSAIQLVAESTEETFRANETSIVFDSKDKQIAVLKGEKDVYYVPLEDIPQEAIDAMVVTEDRKFYSHNGIDIKAITAAFVALVKNKGEITRGASTITQQLARGIFLSTEQTWTRKVKEIFIALELEKKYSKEQILEFYMNNIYFANGYYGIEAASRGYFSKSCKELNLAEITFLCSIPNSPTRYDPVENKENTVERKNRILDQMLAKEKISDVEYNAAYNYEIKLNIPEKKKRNYVETYVLYCATRALMKTKGFEFQYIFKSDEEEAEYDELYSDLYSECQQMLYREGYRIYTSINMKKQIMLQKTINEELAVSKEKGEDGIYQFQGAGVCINNKTGRVVAAVGGRSQAVTGYTFNRAFQSFRQPGSSIKPIVVYTPVFERGYEPYDIVKDAPIEDGPKNSGGGYLGNISIRTAVEQSVNTVAWNLFEEITPEVGINYLHRMRFARISKSDYTQAAALGGMTVGVSPLEMAAAYATIENEGIYREPTCIVSIEDSKGNRIYSSKMNYRERIYDAEASKKMTDVLEGVFTSGTGRGYGLDGMSCAGKTGTTNDKKDGWFVGYTPYYTTSVWVGYDIPRSVDDLLGNTYPARIWNTFMSEIHTNLENVEFPLWEGESTEVYSTPKPTKSPKATKEPLEDEDMEDNEPDDLEGDYNDVPEDYIPDDIIPDDNTMITEPPYQPPVITNAPVAEPTSAPIPTDVLSPPTDASTDVDEGIQNSVPAE